MRAGVKADAPADRVPVVLACGLPGAGKTMLLRAATALRPSHERWLVVENRLAALPGGDAAPALEGIAWHRMTGGCVCCSLAVQFRVLLTRLLREVRPSRVLVEVGASADPAVFAKLLADEWLVRAVRPAGVLLVVDPAQEPKERTGAAREQASAASLVVWSARDGAPAPADLGGRPVVPFEPGKRPQAALRASLLAP